MASDKVIPRPPCPAMTVKQLYAVVMDMERRIHVVRKLIGRLDPATQLKLGKPVIARQWNRKRGLELAGTVICNSCQAPEDWPR